MRQRPRFKLHHVLYTLFFLTLALAFFRLHARVQLTLLGYEIGRMKEEEDKLLKRRSLLTMELAKLSTKEHLMKLSEKERARNTEHDMPLASH